MLMHYAGFLGLLYLTKEHIFRRVEKQIYFFSQNPEISNRQVPQYQDLLAEENGPFLVPLVCHRLWKGWQTACECISLSLPMSASGSGYSSPNLSESNMVGKCFISELYAHLSLSCKDTCGLRTHPNPQ